MGIFNLFSKSFLGIDIGTSSIKVVELSKQKGKTLTNYGTLGAEYFVGKSFQTREKGVFSIEEKNIIEAIQSILKEAGIKSKEAFFAIPDYVSFFTSFDLPPMSESEVPQAVKYEAPRRIPLPLSEVTLDWQIIKGGPGKKTATPLRVLLVTVPNDIIDQYQRIATAVGLKAVALEAEVFAMVRALVKYQDQTGTVCLVDIGDRSTTINIVSQSILKVSHSFDISGEDLTDILSQTLGVDKNRADAIKWIYGISNKNKEIADIIQPSVKSIVEKIKSILDQLYIQDKEKANKVILTGGGSGLPGLAAYFGKSLNLPVEIANPFIDISAPPTLEDTLKKLGPGLTIAVGMALRGF